MRKFRETSHRAQNKTPCEAVHITECNESESKHNEVKTNMPAYWKRNKREQDAYTIMVKGKREGNNARKCRSCETELVGQMQAKQHTHTYIHIQQFRGYLGSLFL